MTSSARWCVLGLGNYGPAYRMHRHNAGYRCVSQLADVEGVEWRKERKFDYGVTPSGVLLCRPRTFINQSGEIWPLIRDKWLLKSQQLIVIVDHLDLPPGTVRIRMQGGTTGHNGIRSLVGWIGNGDFCRIYLGIGHPGSRDLVIPHVLGTPPPEERCIVDRASERVASALQQWDGQDLRHLANTLTES